MEKACESGEWLIPSQWGLHTLAALSRGQQTSFCSSFSGAPKALWVLVLVFVHLFVGIGSGLWWVGLCPGETEGSEALKAACLLVDMAVSLPI